MAQGTRKSLTWGVLLSLALSACSHAAAISVGEEKELGRQAQVETRQRLPMMRDAVVVRYVRDMGMALVKASKPSPFRFDFYVVEDPSINAFAAPGAAIYVNTGTILAADEADQLAGVIAHEIGHATARHVAQGYAQQQRTGFLAGLLSIIAEILSGGRVRAGGAAGLGAYAYSMSYSREFESEADSLGVDTLVHAGWDPHGMPEFFEKIAAKESERGGLGTPLFLSSHPFAADRAAVTRKQIEALGELPELRQDDDTLHAIQVRIRSVMGPDAEERDKRKNKDKDR